MTATIKKIFCSEHGLQEIEKKQQRTSDYLLACGCTRSIPRPRNRPPVVAPLSVEEASLEEKLAHERERHGTYKNPTTHGGPIE